MLGSLHRPPSFFLSINSIVLPLIWPLSFLLQASLMNQFSSSWCGTVGDLVGQATASPFDGVLHYVRLESVDSARHLDWHRKRTVRLLDGLVSTFELTCCMAMLQSNTSDAVVTLGRQGIHPELQGNTGNRIAPSPLHLTRISCNSTDVAERESLFCLDLTVTPKICPSVNDTCFSSGLSSSDSQP